MLSSLYPFTHVLNNLNVLNYNDVGLDIYVDDYHMESFDASEGEDDRHKLWMLMTKLWLPVLFVFTALVNWDNPFAVATRILLFLLITKPSPSSIYLFVERVSKSFCFTWLLGFNT